MRPGYYQSADGTIINGHWHHKSISAGDFYQSHKTDEWFVVDSVKKMNGPEGMSWFCQIRPMTEDEFNAMPKTSPKAEAQLFSDFFDAVENR